MSLFRAVKVEVVEKSNFCLSACMCVCVCRYNETKETRRKCYIISMQIKIKLVLYYILKFNC